MKTVNDIRSAFIDYFVANGHRAISSGPLVPLNDPTLMFTNAGMVQFKNVFTGIEPRNYSRAVTSQKCVRAGGKHNDLENVGYTARHHTFFEMLGNFSFGDYFKDEAIYLAWNFITKELGLPKDKLLATVYAEDDQAFDLWKKIAGFPENRIIRISTSDNFWAMGETGPCGPCSEIFFDHGDHIPGGPPGSRDEDGDRFIEIWNLVFMQYEQQTSEVRTDLPKPSIDTGMGLERISAVMQGTYDNYETDLMQALIHTSAEVSDSDADGSHKVSHRVIADHLRATSFLIADGVMPSNEGRGYVLRRIMRRAMRHAHLIGAIDPMIFKLVPTLVTQMGQAFPELVRAEAMIKETLKLEETRFKTTLDRGLKLLDEATADLEQGDVLSGETAFKLYDTFGFPLDLTQDALRNQGMSVDENGFNAAMNRQRADARAGWAGSGDAITEEVWFSVREELGATEFLGYETENAEGQILAIIVNGKRVNTAADGEEASIIVNQTPFYGESGGQIGDSGEIRCGDVMLIVDATQKKLGDLHVHTGIISYGILEVGNEVTLKVNHQRRSRLRDNHSATHLLHEALRRKLGDHVTQKGSLVAPDKLRFDIAHPKPISLDEISDVEDQVNDEIRANSIVTTLLMTPDEAIEAGAMALFGEKYGDEVRVVSMGNDYSTELCGGTHVERTGNIGLIKILSESAVAAGVRRIEALTGKVALDYLESQDEALLKVANILKTKPGEVTSRVQSLVDERKKMERELVDLRKKLASVGGDVKNTAPATKDICGIPFASRLITDMPAKDLKGLADEVKGQIGSGVVALISVTDTKVSLVVAVSEDLSNKVNAVDLVCAGSAAVGGKGGGGRPDMAQAGGPDVAKAGAALKAIEEALSS
jgi:alanyl-tRNA synthetase